MNRLLRVCLLTLLFVGCQSWEWSDFLAGSIPFMPSSTTTLTFTQVSEMRVRDIKRRLTRNHGYGADELGKILDKKELINALAFEEHKLRQVETAEFQRQLFKNGIIFTALAGAIVLFWPLLQHVWEVAHVNFVVYTDRKLFEAKRCWELRSNQGCLGVAIMLVLDLLQLWLTISVILSWIMTSKYFFPVPSVSIHPAAFMGGQVASGPLARYGINVGPMMITWLLRFLQGRLEKWVGLALAKAHKVQMKKARASETLDEKEARRAARQARRAAREEAQRTQQEEQQSRTDPVPTPDPPMTQEFQSNPFANEDDSSTREQVQNTAATAVPQTAEPKVGRYSALDELD